MIWRENPLFLETTKWSEQLTAQLAFGLEGVWKKYHFPVSAPNLYWGCVHRWQHPSSWWSLRFRSKCQLAVLRWCIILFVLCVSTKHLYTYTWKPNLPDASTFPFKQPKLHPNWGCPIITDSGSSPLLGVSLGLESQVVWVSWKGSMIWNTKKRRRACQEWAFQSALPSNESIMLAT